jgi:hypothetical protein
MPSLSSLLMEPSETEVSKNSIIERTSFCFFSAMAKSYMLVYWGGRWVVERGEAETVCACICCAATRLWSTTTYPPTCFFVLSLVGSSCQYAVASTDIFSAAGEAPTDPVVSTKSGNVYERRLITKYLAENGTDPITGEKLEESDLLSIKASE